MSEAPPGRAGFSGSCRRRPGPRRGRWLRPASYDFRSIVSSRAARPGAPAVGPAPSWTRPAPTGSSVMPTRILFAATFLCLGALTCGARPSEGARRPVGLANPASTNCGRQGGRTEIRSGDGGQVGSCRFPDGGSARNGRCCATGAASRPGDTKVIENDLWLCSRISAKPLARCRKFELGQRLDASASWAVGVRRNPEDCFRIPSHGGDRAGNRRAVGRPLRGRGDRPCALRAGRFGARAGPCPGVSSTAVRPPPRRRAREGSSRTAPHAKRRSPAWRMSAAGVPGGGIRVVSAMAAPEPAPSASHNRLRDPASNRNSPWLRVAVRPVSK